MCLVMKFETAERWVEEVEEVVGLHDRQYMRLRMINFLDWSRMPFTLIYVCKIAHHSYTLTFLHSYTLTCGGRGGGSRQVSSSISSVDRVDVTATGVMDSSDGSNRSRSNKVDNNTSFDGAVVVVPANGVVVTRNCVIDGKSQAILILRR